MELGGPVSTSSTISVEHGNNETRNEKWRWRGIFAAAKPSDLQMQQLSEFTDVLYNTVVVRFWTESFSSGKERYVSSVVFKSENLCGTLWAKQCLLISD